MRKCSNVLPFSLSFSARAWMQVESAVCFRLLSERNGIELHVPNSVADPETETYYENHVDFHFSECQQKSVADPGFSKWGGAVLSQMGGRTSCFQVKSA